MGELISFRPLGPEYRSSVEQLADDVDAAGDAMLLGLVDRSAPAAFRAVALAQRAGLLPTR